jgi:vitamin B12/bleomycin/antimicrobial peptide transport system ATP-binding/permease protein
MASDLVVRGRSFLDKVWRLARPYWFSEERWRARILLGAIVALSLGLVYILVLLNEWNRLFYNSLEQRSYGDFKALLLRFSVLAAVFIAASVYKLYLTQMLEMRWRAWLTRQYVGDWMARQVYYRLELESRSTDNPDQRIAEDLRLFTNMTLNLSLGLLSSGVTLVSFIGILWLVSGPLDLTLGGTSLHIPGYMVWTAIAYAIVGSALTHLIGRPLIRLNFLQERFEADFRFSLVRLRENAEGVALYRGEPSEQRSLLQKFERIRTNWWELMRYTKYLTGFTVGYAQIAIIFPILVAAPRYFTGAITLGGLMQISQAFGQVQGALSWFVDSYSSLANWKASVDRLLTFSEALVQARAEAAAGSGVRIERQADPHLRAEDLDLNLPDGRAVLDGASFAVAPGERVLLSGPSGAGKSTLFRAIAGIWPFGRGRVQMPEQARVLFLPQKPYLPIASLREVVSYPAGPGAFGDDEIREVLRQCRLEAFADRLDDVGNWALRMSLGEQQRLAVARALLHRPEWLFLDEATASLDETNETQIYALLQERLPGTAIVSIAHRPTLAAHHQTHWTLVPDGDRARLARLDRVPQLAG